MDIVVLVTTQILPVCSRVVQEICAAMPPLTCRAVAKLSAHHSGVGDAPPPAADSPPLAVDADLHATLFLSGSAYQTHFSGLALKAAVKHCGGEGEMEE